MEEENKKSSKKKLFIIIGVIISIVVIGGIVYATFIRDNYSNNNNKINSGGRPSNSTEIFDPGIVDKKPIIYLYPEEETEISVIVGNPENLTHTYPKYNNGWNIIAKPNGELIDLKSGRTLYSLYWEGINTVSPNMTEGFIVEGKSTIEFLEEKLAILGLSQREANEFIIYWLPQMENNIYNFIRFQNMEEINNNMPLQITPSPDNIIRVMMEFKALDKEINVKEQLLETPQRNGFIVVEWGGTEIK